MLIELTEDELVSIETGLVSIEAGLVSIAGGLLAVGFGLNSIAAGVTLDNETFEDALDCIGSIIRVLLVLVDNLDIWGVKEDFFNLFDGGDIISESIFDLFGQLYLPQPPLQLLSVHLIKKDVILDWLENMLDFGN